MVRETLAGTKLQTRRAVKHPLLCNLSFIVNCGDGWWGDEEGEGQARCPYGQPGDRLWVRETWYCDDYRVQRGPYLKPDDMDIEEARGDGTLIYRASSGERPYEAEQPVWRPAIHMPRWASRITLKVTGVRVERLQDISEADALAEGIAYSERFNGYCIGMAEHFHSHDPRESYRSLWRAINGAESWDANPWVWVVEFKKVN